MLLEIVDDMIAAFAALSILYRIKLYNKNWSQTRLRLFILAFV